MAFTMLDAIVRALVVLLSLARWSHAMPQLANDHGLENWNMTASGSFASSSRGAASSHQSDRDSVVRSTSRASSGLRPSVTPSAPASRTVPPSRHVHSPSRTASRPSGPRGTSPHHTGVSSSHKHANLTQPSKSKHGCPAACTRDNGRLTLWAWRPVSYSETITVATVVTIVDPGSNKTTVTTLLNDSYNGTASAPTNSAGTKTDGVKGRFISASSTFSSDLV